MKTLTSPRLLLRPWRLEDRAPFAAMSRDPEVMRYFPALLERAESDVHVERMQTLIEKKGWGFWGFCQNSLFNLLG